MKRACTTPRGSCPFWGRRLQARLTSAWQPSDRPLPSAAAEELIVDFSFGDAAAACDLFDGVHAGDTRAFQRFDGLFDGRIVWRGNVGFADEESHFAFDGVAGRELDADLGGGAAEELLVEFGELACNYN